MRCMVMAERIWVKKHAVMLVSTSELSDGSMPRLCILMDRRDAMAHVHLDRERDRDLHALVLHLLPAEIRHAGHVDEQVVGSEPDVVVDAAGAGGEVVEDRADAERREDVCRDLKSELAPDRPCLGIGRLAEIDLAAHDHGDELVARGEPALLDAGRILSDTGCPQRCRRSRNSRARRGGRHRSAPSRRRRNAAASGGSARCRARW